MNERKTFRRMVNGNQDVNTLLMGIIQPLEYLPEWNCGGKSVKVDYRKINNGMIYQKNWAFRKLFDYQLLRLKEDGEIDRIKKNYFGNKIGNLIKIAPLSRSSIWLVNILKSHIVYVRN